jgi:transcriptional regulator with XRE-family HTH domain
VLRRVAYGYGMTQDMDAPTWTFGDRLRKARRSRRLSQREFARLLGESEKSIANWESDVSRPRDVVALAKKVQATYGVPAEWVLGVSKHSTCSASSDNTLLAA